MFRIDDFTFVVIDISLDEKVVVMFEVFELFAVHQYCKLTWC